MTAVFRAGEFSAVEMSESDVEALQRFYEQHPEYHVMVSGAPVEPGLAREDFVALPPADWKLGRKWMLLLRDGEGRVVGVADVLQDFLADGVWHVGLFLIATPLHGTGAAQQLYAGLEAWMRGLGARWSRLGVVEANLRGRRFWRQVGYTEVRTREDYPLGQLKHRLHVMAKPLAGGDFAQYAQLVARDRP